MVKIVRSIYFMNDYHRGISRIYFNSIFRKVVKIGSLNKIDGLILDFGCGHKHLNKYLSNKELVGYDIIPSLSDIKDYTKLKPDVIVCNNVFQYMAKKEINDALSNFIKMNKKAKVIVALPTENIIAKIGKRLTNFGAVHSEFKSHIEEIYKILSGFYLLKNKKKVLTMTEVSLWVDGVEK